MSVEVDVFVDTCIRSASWSKTRLRSWSVTAMRRCESGRSSCDLIRCRPCDWRMGTCPDVEGIGLSNGRASGVRHHFAVGVSAATYREGVSTDDLRAGLMRHLPVQRGTDPFTRYLHINRRPGR